MKPSEILDKAADLIEPEGKWTQRTMARGKRNTPVIRPRSALCYCAVGALQVAAGAQLLGYITMFDGDESLQDAAKFVARVATHGDDYDDVLVWNDAPSRTQAEVVAALRKAAELARSEAQ